MIYNCANWADLPWTEVRPGVRRKAFTGEGATFAMNELQPHHEPRPHKHPFEQIAYIAAGVCDYHIEDQVFRLTPGGMLVIPPNLMHGTYHSGLPDNRNRRPHCHIAEGIHPQRADCERK